MSSTSCCSIIDRFIALLGTAAEDPGGEFGNGKEAGASNLDGYVRQCTKGKWEEMLLKRRKSSLFNSGR